MYKRNKLVKRCYKFQVYNIGVKKLIGNSMKIRTKPVENVRIRADRGQLLKDKAYQISMMSGAVVTESDIVNFLIDTYTAKVTVIKGELKIDD